MRLAASITTAVRRVLDLLLVAVVAAVLATIVLARVVPALTGTSTLVIAGRSMEPTIAIGSAVVAVPVVPGSLRVGDVVSLKVGADQAVFTHRITRIVDRDGAPWLATKGDANEGEDPALVPAESVIGRVELVVPYAGYLIALLSSATGVLFTLGIAGSILAAAWLLEALELDLRAAGHRRARQGQGIAADPDATEGGPTPYATLLEQATVLTIAYGEPIATRAGRLIALEARGLAEPAPDRTPTLTGDGGEAIPA